MNASDFKLSSIRKASYVDEMITKPLLEIANAKTWKEALNIIYINGSTLSIYPEINIPCLVEINGNISHLDKQLERMEGKAKHELKPITAEIMQLLIPKLFVYIKDHPEMKDADGMEEYTEIIKFVMAEMQKSIQNLISLSLSAVRPAFDLLMTSLIDYLCKLEEQQSRLSPTKKGYRLLIKSLLELELIEGWLQLSICPECNNHQLTISKYPPLTTKCPKCRKRWIVLSLYGFKPEYAAAKAENRDIVYFISSYLRNKIISEYPMKEAEVIPNYKEICDNGSDTVEVDVYVPNHHIGFECKLFEDPFGPMTQPRIGSIVGDLFKQSSRYAKIGIEDIIIITNLPEEACKRVSSALNEKNSKKHICKQISVMPRDIDTLLSLLDKKAKEIAEQKTKDYNKLLEQKKDGTI